MDSGERTILIEVFSEQAENYDAKVPFFTPLATDLVELADVGPGQRVLDIGCGRGAVLFQAAERVGPDGSVVGIDIAPGMVTATAADIRRRGLDHVSVALMDGQQPDFEPNSFDHVLGSMSIIMVPGLDRAFRHYRTLLREGGTLGFTGPAIDADPLDWRMGPFHLKRFLAEALPNLNVADIADHLDVFGKIEPDRMIASLQAAGYRNPRAVDVTTVVRAETARDLVAWTFTHGARLFWNMVDEPRRSEYARQWIERIEAEFPDGSPEYPTINRVFLADR